KDLLEVRLEVLESMPTLWPVRGVISSGFGTRISPFTRRAVFHRGLDIQAPMGAEVRAAGAGKVVRSSFDPSFGNVVVIDHGNGYRSLYAHMSEILVRLGDYVQRGQVIGRVGTTGRSTGPHLHFEIRVNGVPTNPFRYLG
ncbi:MAG: M23 family metallopeptidase, partial [Deltaproteobacteria bacterium]